MEIVKVQLIKLIFILEWASVGTISTATNISGFPMVNLKSIADSAKDEPSNGHIYFYLTTLDFTGKDLAKSNKLTVMVSNDQDLSCTNKGTDPMEPTCARIIISGSAVKVTEFSTRESIPLNKKKLISSWMLTQTSLHLPNELLSVVIQRLLTGSQSIHSICAN